MNEDRLRASQQLFDEKYITGEEIRQELHITRQGLIYAEKKGKFPKAIKIKGTQAKIWERALILPVIRHWKWNRNMLADGVEK